MLTLLLILHIILIIQCNCFNHTYYCANNQWNPFTDPIHISAIILARGGSKGIPLKNLAKLNNNSLISNALQQIKEVQNFNSIWVSTDNNLIATEVHNLNTLVHWRSEYTATDDASSLIAVQEFIRYHPEIDIVGLIQCTSPFIKKQYLIDAIQQFYANPKLQCVFSVTRSFKLRWQKMQQNFVPLNFNIEKRPRRQDWNGEFIENGMFYFAKRHIINNGFLQTNKCGIVEVNEIDSFEIDTDWDLKLANLIYNLNLI